MAKAPLTKRKDGCQEEARRPPLGVQRPNVDIIRHAVIPIEPIEAFVLELCHQTSLPPSVSALPRPWVYADHPSSHRTTSRCSLCGTSAGAGPSPPPAGSAARPETTGITPVTPVTPAPNLHHGRRRKRSLARGIPSRNQKTRTGAIERRNHPSSTMTLIWTTERPNPRRRAPRDTRRVGARTQTDVTGNPRRRNTMNPTRMIGESRTTRRSGHHADMMDTSLNPIIPEIRARSRPRKHPGRTSPAAREIHKTHQDGGTSRVMPRILIRQGRRNNTTATRMEDTRVMRNHHLSCTLSRQLHTRKLHRTCKMPSTCRCPIRRNLLR